MSWEVNLKKAQEANRRTMRKFHDVCRKHGITYYYDSGGLIGAVRHKSFIPWDDDVDVAMTRQEYYRLCMEVTREEWGEDFELIRCEALAPGGFFDFVPRLMNMKDEVPLRAYDKCAQKLSPRYRDRMGLDIFILDNAYDSDFKQRILKLKLTLVYGLAMGHRDFVDLSEYSGISKAVVWILSHIGRHVNLNWIYDKYTILSSSAGDDTKRYFYSNNLIEMIGILFDKEWYNGTVPVQVDDDMFDAPRGYDEVLKNIYGDYMELPPEDKRVPDHIRLE